MGSVGGVFAMRGASLRAEALGELSRGMCLRGRHWRSGRLLERCGLIYHGGAGEPFLSQPICGKEEGTVAVAVDGDRSAEEVMAAYRAAGIDAVSRLGGSFALAIWDERTGELILARDRGGRVPLYYAEEGDTLFFCSEIKGLLPLLEDGAEVDREALLCHLREPYREAEGGHLYRRIRSLPSGHCGVGSRLGFSVFPHSFGSEGRETVSEAGVTVSLDCPNREELTQMLAELLYAFDYPMFDPRMMGLWRVARDVKRRRLVYEDRLAHADPYGARVCGDRLGALLGVALCPVFGGSADFRVRVPRGAEQALRALCMEEREELDRLLGAEWRRLLQDAESPWERVCRLGMLYQTALWARGYGVTLV